MIDQDFEIVRLDKCMFGSIAEEIVWMPDNILIERRRRSHHHGAGASAAAAGASGALPGSGNRARVARHHDRVERAHVDPEFQRARAYDAADTAVAQAALDFPALIRQIPAAVAANRFLLAWRLSIRFLQIGQ